MNDREKRHVAFYIGSLKKGERSGFSSIWPGISFPGGIG